MNSLSYSSYFFDIGTTDSFSVTSPSGLSPPVICGTNTGEHSKYRQKTNTTMSSHFGFDLLGIFY